MILKRESAGFYRNIENDEMYCVRAVNREYPGVRKKPEYYLEKKTDTGLKYLSGLFRLSDGEYSFDIKDQYGVKILYKLKFLNEGAEIQIEKRAG